MNKPFIFSSLLGALLLSGTAAATCANANLVETTPTSRYTFGSGGVVTDTITGLMWKRCLQGQTFSDNSTPGNYLDDACLGSATDMDWQVALNQAPTANTANDSGHNDWRVPNLKELKSTVEYCRARPAINQEVFPFNDVPGFETWVWSNSPVFGNEKVWSVSLSSHSSGNGNQEIRGASRDSSHRHYVRLVRGQ